MGFRHIAVRRADTVVTIVMNDPSTLNAASISMVEELLEAFEQAADEARAIVLTGAGKGFCSGANLSGDSLDPSHPDYDAGAYIETHYNPLMRKIRDTPVPVVAAVNGAAAGIGCSIALACDFVVAGERSYFLQAFRNIGLVPDGGSAYLIQRAAGRLRAVEMMMLGERIMPQQSLAWGLVNRVVADDELLATATDIAKRLADGPTVALRMIKEIAWAATESSFEEMLGLERRLQLAAGRTADHREGVAAFLEKRQARFTGS